MHELGWSASNNLCRLAEKIAPHFIFYTREIVPVEPGEAEWNLDVLESLFDFYFVAPARTKARRDALNKKLADAGKKPLK
jgi:hypothetical protein